MDRLGRRFVHELLPPQCLLLSDSTVTLYQREGRGYRRRDLFRDLNLSTLDSPGGRKLFSRLDEKGLGIVLGPGHFIFNILDFQRLPRRRSKCEEMVDWRLGKVFPDNLEQYIHQYYTFGRKRVFSLLVKGKVHRILQSTLGGRASYIGCSTLLSMNYLYHRPWPFSLLTPDLMIQLSEGLVVVSAHHRSVPYYIRKFKSREIRRLQEEIAQVVDFLQKQYDRTVTTYALVNSHPEIRDADLPDLTQLGIRGRRVDFQECLGKIR